jgi:FAD:protein FMN transferase
MTKRLVLRLVLAVVCASVLMSARAEDFTFRHENVMGTSLELIVRAETLVAARDAEVRALAEIDRLSRIFSGYDEASEFRRWQDAPGRPLRIADELFDVLKASDHWHARSGGAFDPRVEGFSRLWSTCERAGRLPIAEEIADARPSPTAPAWRLDPASRTAERLPGGPVSLNAIAKGYIVEKACEAATRDDRRIDGVLLNVGGDLRAAGSVARRIGIAAPRGDSEATDPLAVVEVRDQAVATSGDAQRGFRINGRWYSHIFDPRTGMPACGVIAATVIADRSAEADALATALNVLAPEIGLKLVESQPGVACLIVAADGSVARSARWQEYERPLLMLAQAPSTPTHWADGWEFRIDFEINRPEDGGGRYRRPYVAVWVENAEGFPVRNLILWVSQTGSGPFQWLPDLKRWYLADQARKKLDKTELVLTLSRPTRPPGKYSVVWNGLDDHKKPLPRGKYTICIDAAREHGTSQSIRIPVTVDGQRFSSEDKGNVEIKAASVTFRPLAATK